MGCMMSALDELDEEVNQTTVISDASRVFNLIDNDRSGTISTAEFASSESWMRFMRKLEGRPKQPPSLPAEPTLKDFLKFITKLDDIEVSAHTYARRVQKPHTLTCFAFVPAPITSRLVQAAVLLELMEKELVMAPIKAHARELFELLDADGSGSIDLQTEAGSLAGFPGKLALEDMDTSGDGVISVDEFVAAVHSKAKSNPGRTGIIMKAAVLHVKQAADRAKACDTPAVSVQAQSL